MEKVTVMSEVYQKEEPDWDADKPFCDACETKDWDFLHNYLTV